MESKNISNTTNDSDYYSATLPYLVDIYDRLSFYSSVCILLPGWLLNFLVLGAFIDRRFWKPTTNIGYYYTVSPIFSNLVISIGIINFLPVSFDNELTLVSVASCRVIWFFRIFFLNTNFLFQVQMSIDRALNVVYPKRFSWLVKSKLNLLMITSVIVVISALYASIHFFRYLEIDTTTSQAVNQTTLSVCVLPGSLLSFFSFSFFLIRLICYLANLASNIQILRKLIHSKMHLAHETHHKLSQKEFAFACSIFSANAVQFFFMLPYLVVLLIQLVYSLTPNMSDSATLFVNQLYNITNLGNYIPEGLSFYIIYGSNKVFRSELHSILFGHRVASDETHEATAVAAAHNTTTS